jgi:hypothetical protein
MRYQYSITIRGRVKNFLFFAPGCKLALGGPAGATIPRLYRPYQRTYGIDGTLPIYGHLGLCGFSTPVYKRV